MTAAEDHVTDWNYTSLEVPSRWCEKSNLARKSTLMSLQKSTTQRIEYCVDSLDPAVKPKTESLFGESNDVQTRNPECVERQQTMLIYVLTTKD